MSEAALAEVKIHTIGALHRIRRVEVDGVDVGGRAFKVDTEQKVGAAPVVHISFYGRLVEEYDPEPDAPTQPEYVPPA